MNQIGKMLIAAGLLLAALGVCLIAAGKLNIPFGKLPGDITYQKKNLTVFAPFGTMLFVSVILTLILNIFSRWK
ncbi:DUF2905 domain-containing protein [Synergistes jonesii]|uniref:DUF2905 domain-containing protein n=1 Tax=Synergistes jonesii TaxID=2754 RepID=A0A073ISN4_9BACT|nr:DUF2905 domain-containing protein [Synergistes jonesii]KEJ92530.1 hypothetical protein EH55_03475 [Synergistes jonesii]OFB61698.1 hypothetical protein JS72_10035 [Synergistes jonesii]OFB63191.1 hypothetical protein JS73_05850 [Synergistes jonesii]OFB64063.1 hypothetical protein JS79_06375 [Synergistes jonesii]OFB67897.1 hypothetical protein JS78_05860 [Synergistes jonesii]